MKHIVQVTAWSVLFKVFLTMYNSVIGPPAAPQSRAHPPSISINYRYPPHPSPRGSAYFVCLCLPFARAFLYLVAVNRDSFHYILPIFLFFISPLCLQVQKEVRMSEAQSLGVPVARSSKDSPAVASQSQPQRRTSPHLFFNTGCTS